jgi:hypothetical protein
VSIPPHSPGRPFGLAGLGERWGAAALAVILSLISAFIAPIAARTVLAIPPGQYFAPANVRERQPDHDGPD